MICSSRAALGLSLAMVALLSACSGAYHADIGPEGDDFGLEGAGEDGIVLGVSWQELSYPPCWSALSDPDGDGWGWENNQSCIVVSSSSWGFYYPTCTTSFSDPDGDGWGWEFNRSCRVATPSSTTTTSSTTATSSSGGMICSNPEGTHSTMAALAVAAAMELKRWQPTQDFTVGWIDGSEGLVLSPTGKARCADGCRNVQALLDFQRNAAHQNVVFPGNVKLDAYALRSRMVAKFRDQLACEKQPSNGGTTNCPVEEHTLTFQRSERGGCDTNYFFVARKPDGQPLQYSAQLKNKLLWADQTNPYIGFQSIGEVVSIDPTYGLNEAGSTTSGSCTAACAKFSASDMAGQCCSCNGSMRRFQRSLWSSFTYLCK